jgi:hypothetical protein
MIAADLRPSCTYASLSFSQAISGSPSESKIVKPTVPTRYRDAMPTADSLAILALVVATNGVGKVTESS